MAKSWRTALVAAIGCVGALAALVVLAYYVRPLRVADARALDSLGGHREGVLRGPAEALAQFADPLPVLGLAAIACAIALLRRRPFDAVAVVAVVAGASVTTQVLKHLLAHPRYESFLEIQPDPNSFPSGHVTAATATAIVFTWVVAPRLRRPVAVLGVLYVLAMGLAVLVLRRHLVSDVLGGVLVALAWGFGVLAAQWWLSERFGEEEIPRPGAAVGASFRRDCV